jgi:hypothetical protein
MTTVPWGATEQSFAAQVILQRLNQPATTFVSHTQRLRDAGSDHRSIADRRQRYEERPIGKCLPFRRVLSLL